MSDQNFSQLTIGRWLALLTAGRAKAGDLVQYYLKRIAELNPSLNAYLEVFADAPAAAAAVDARLARGEPPRPLEGVPLAIKDNILIKGRIASASSKILENYVAVYDATVIERLRAAGAIFLGRTNLDEFAMGSSTENSAAGPTKNPLDPTRVAGGSSGGSAAAVAADLALAALGSDTGGSVRQPAAFCGVVGLKPTYGAVSRFGLIALASSLDQIGPLARTAADAEIIFQVIAGQDEKDATSYDSEKVRPLDPKILRSNLKMKLGVPRNFFKTGLAPAAAKDFEQALKRLSAGGYELVEIDLPAAQYALAAYYVIMPAEASSNLARYDGFRYGRSVAGRDLIDDYRQTRGEGFGRETRRRIILGTYVLSAGYYEAYYQRAVAVKQTIAWELAQAFDQVAAIVTPTTPTAAFPLGERIHDPVQMYLADLFTVPANLAGLPAISTPSGKDERGLPFGLQFIAPRGGEDYLFKLSAHYAHL
ncbi:MAG TPA: Asp-tRNA(Asn)/Glu-tRNA(Gln) amidotransferase subunit GatA [Candidatus Paceibacterota bacterium]